MAKLTPKDPQFGIPVATRIRGALALRFNAEADKAGKTLSRYVAEFIEKALADEKKVTELISLLAEEKEIEATHERKSKELNTQLLKEKEIAFVQEKRLKGLESQLVKEREIAKQTAGKFIVEITGGNKKQASQFIETYNTILKDEKCR